MTGSAIAETDESLMARIIGGDQQAFASLVRRHSGRFFAAAYRLCTNAQDAEDIVQEAFLKIWSKPKLWDPARGAKFTTWFYRVVTNLTLDHLRRRRPEKQTEDLTVYADERIGQDIQVIESQQSRALEAAIQNLPERQRAALNLCFYEGLSNREAADILGIKLKALESLLMRAKAGLYDDLRRRGFILEQEKKYG